MPKKIKLALCIIKTKSALEMTIVNQAKSKPRSFLPKLIDVALLANILFHRLFKDGGELAGKNPAEIFSKEPKDLIESKAYCTPQEILEINSGRKIVTFDIIEIDKTKVKKTGKTYIQIHRNVDHEKGDSRAKLGTLDMVLTIMSLTEILGMAGLTPTEVLEAITGDTKELYQKSFILNNHKKFQRIRKDYNLNEKTRQAEKEKSREA